MIDSKLTDSDSVESFARMLRSIDSFIPLVRLPSLMSTRIGGRLESEPPGGPRDVKSELAR